MTVVVIDLANSGSSYAGAALDFFASDEMQDSISDVSSVLGLTKSAIAGALIEEYDAILNRRIGVKWEYWDQIFDFIAALCSLAQHSQTYWESAGMAAAGYYD